MDTKNYDPATYSAMQLNKPVAKYRKTMLGQLHVTLLSPFDKTQESLLLSGDPKTDPKATIEVWSEIEDVFFQRRNTESFKEGKLERVPVETTLEAVKYSDIELLEILSMPFLGLNKQLQEIKEPAVLIRMIELATEHDKTNKIIKNLEVKLSQLQQR